MKGFPLIRALSLQEAKKIKYTLTSGAVFCIVLSVYLGVLTASLLKSNQKMFSETCIFKPYKCMHMHVPITLKSNTMFIFVSFMF